MSNTFAGFEKVDVKTLTLTSLSSKRGIDIIPLVRNIEIYSSIFSPVITGSIKVVDSTNITQSLPIIGEEVLEIVFQSPNREPFVKTCFVYGVEQQEYNDNGAAVSFVLRFATIDHYKALTESITKGAKTNIKEFVLDILTQDLKTENKLNCEDTIGLERIIIPKLNIWESIEYLRTRAVSVEYSSPFVFFEDQTGYNFLSYEKLIEQREAKADDLTFIQEAFNPGAGDDAGQNTVLAKQYRNVSQFEVITKTNSIDRVLSGGMSSNVILFDPFNKTTKVNNYNYNDLKDIIKKPLADSFYPEHSRGFANTMSTPTTTTMMIIDAQDENYLSQENSGAKELFINALKGTCVGFTTNGDSQLQPGDIINILAPKRTNNPTNDKQISGKYIIGNLKHGILDGAMFTTIEAYRFGFSEQVIQEPIVEEILTQTTLPTLGDITESIIGLEAISANLDNLELTGPLSAIKTQIDKIRSEINNISSQINSAGSLKDRVTSVISSISNIKTSVLTEYGDIYYNIQNVKNVVENLNASNAIQLLRTTGLVTNEALLNNITSVISLTTIISQEKDININNIGSLFTDIQNNLTFIQGTSGSYSTQITNINNSITTLHSKTEQISEKYNSLMILKNRLHL